MVARDIGDQWTYSEGGNNRFEWFFENDVSIRIGIQQSSILQNIWHFQNRKPISMEFWIFFSGTRKFSEATIGLRRWKLFYSPKKYMKGTCSNQETLEKSGKKAEGSPLYHHINNGELSAKIRYENDAHLNNLRSKIAHRIWKPKVQIHLTLQESNSTPIYPEEKPAVQESWEE